MNIKEYKLSPQALVMVQGSSKGTQPKYYENGYWYKVNQCGYEGLSEYLVSKVLECSNADDYAAYEPCIINGRSGCRSKNFLKENESFLSFQRLYELMTGESLQDRIRLISQVADRIGFVKEFLMEYTGFDCSRYLSQILTLDMLTLNTDRHLNNLGLIVDTSASLYKAAPIFDNGNALLSDWDRFCKETIEENLEAFYGRSDEIGMIAQTTHHVCSCLRQTIDDVDRILCEIAQGNLSVDVSQNEAYYIGDFKTLSESLKSIHTNLVNVIRDISRVANQVDTSADQVSAGAQALSQGTNEQAVSIDGLVSNVTAITSQIQTSTLRCQSASEQVGKAAGYASEADEKMGQLMNATKNIEQSSAKIVTVIKTIEDIAFQTNILALNASVEAARAGSAGKGFSVVADEVRNLAAKSAEAAQNTDALINHSIHDVKNSGGMGWIRV